MVTVKNKNKLIYMGNPLEKATFPGRYIPINSDKLIYRGNPLEKATFPGRYIPINSDKLIYKGNPLEKATFPGRYIPKQVNLQGKSFGKGYVSGTLYTIK